MITGITIQNVKNGANLLQIEKIVNIRLPIIRPVRRFNTRRILPPAPFSPSKRNDGVVLLRVEFSIDRPDEQFRGQIVKAIELLSGELHKKPRLYPIALGITISKVAHYMRLGTHDHWSTTWKTNVSQFLREMQWIPSSSGIPRTVTTRSEWRSGDERIWSEALIWQKPPW